MQDVAAGGCGFESACTEPCKLTSEKVERTDQERRWPTYAESTSFRARPPTAPSLQFRSPIASSCSDQAWCDCRPRNRTSTTGSRCNTLPPVQICTYWPGLDGLSSSHHPHLCIWHFRLRPTPPRTLVNLCQLA